MKDRNGGTSDANPRLETVTTNDSTGRLSPVHSESRVRQVSDEKSALAKNMFATAQVGDPLSLSSSLAHLEKCTLMGYTLSAKNLQARDVVEMAREAQLTSLSKKQRVHISKSLNIPKTWYLLGPSVAEHIAGPDYIPIPHLIDVKAYQIGHIFVQEASDIQCFCAEPQLKVLGPIRDFLVPGKSSPRWLSKDFPAIKTTADDVNFRVVIESGKNKAKFRAYDCYYLEKPADMSMESEEVTIDRSSHEDLSTAEWFGLITGVVIADTSDVIVTRSKRERAFYIGEKPHTILFKHEICRMDEMGTVYETSMEEMECKWLPVEERDMNSLPLAEFVSQSTKIKS
ncbi:hypothetical protein WH47_00545 [Habropoda laboriosa]|uniref:Uncharacterized protein n=1 Tax=Habropoda laboriosa TaxID=597456 RepID=A0A0L7R3W0_9HYME|nr:hypothetical protein WH47_00545 [Habropoda laboriosa]